MSTPSSTTLPAPSVPPCAIVSLDIGSSSVRALLFDGNGQRMEGYTAQVPYQIRTTPDGGAEIDPEALAQITVDCLDEAHRLAREAGLAVAAVGISCFWHGLMGVGEGGAPTVPILHLLDTRSDSEVPRVPARQAATGCAPHASFWPAKLLWLERNRPAELQATRRWIGFPEYLFAKLFGPASSGNAGASVSMASATGLWNQSANDYDAATLAALPIAREQLADPAHMDEAESDLLPEFRKLWPGFANGPVSTQWFPAIGDGACNHLGSAGAAGSRFSLSVGTTGALRAMIAQAQVNAMEGAFRYRLDRHRALVGGAISNGGDVYAWTKKTLALPKDLEARLEHAVPGAHGLTMLPFFSGERTPYWRSDLRAAIAGMSFSTGAFDIFQASLEAVALGFRQMYMILITHLGSPEMVIASGGALGRSPAWSQMIADALGRPIVISTETEASSRGAVLYALERLNRSSSSDASANEVADDPPASLGAVFEPRAEYAERWRSLAEARAALYGKLFGF